MIHFLRARDPAGFRELVEQIYEFAAEKVRAAGSEQSQDLDEVLTQAAELVDAKRQQAMASTMSRRIAEQRAEEQRQADRLTERDPDVQEAKERLKRLKTQDLWLLREGQPNEVDAVAIRMLLEERTARVGNQTQSEPQEHRQ